MDPSKELAPDLGLPKCSIKEAWPFDAPGSGVDGFDATPHWAARHASGHWVAEAIRHSPYHTKDIKEADMWYVNTHCYALWHESFWHLAQQDDSAPPFNPFNEVSSTISRLVVEGIMQMKYFTRTAGRRYIISRPTAGTPPGGILDTCARLKRSFLLTSERAVFCDNDRDRAANGDSLILPLVVIDGVNVTRRSSRKGHRDIFLFYKSRCPVDMDAEVTKGARGGASVELKHGASMAGEPSMLGQRLLAAMYSELSGSDSSGDDDDDDGVDMSDVDVTCFEDGDPAHTDILAAMRRSVFCPVMAFGSQATRSLPAAALSGCLPVFFGPYFHALPFAGDINYRSIAVFFNITESGRDPEPEEGSEDALRPKPPGELEPNARLEDIVVEVPSFTAALRYLKSIPGEVIAEMQAVLEVERLKFYYPPLPGDQQSAAGEIIVRRMCEYATKLNGTLAAVAAEREERFDKLPKLQQAGKASATTTRRLS